MQIGISFTCRHCGSEQSLTWDTSGSLNLGQSMTDTFELACTACGETSGQLEPRYMFREQDGPAEGEANLAKPVQVN